MLVGALLMWPGLCSPSSRSIVIRNKRRTAERQPAYFAKHADRRVVVVIGDKPGDAEVNDGVAPDENCLKIGFFDHSDEHPHSDLPKQRPLIPDSGGGSEPTETLPLLQEKCNSDTARTIVGELPSESEKKSRGNSSSGLRREERERTLKSSLTVAAAARQRGGGGGDGCSSSENDMSFLDMVDTFHYLRNPRLDGEEGANNIIGGGSGSSAWAGRIINHGGRLGQRDDTQSVLLANVRHTGLSTTNRHTTAMLGLDGAAGAMDVTAEDGSCPTSDIKKTLEPGRGSVAGKTKVEEMLQTYRERFDVVAHGGHSMEIVSIAVRYLVQDTFVEMNESDQPV